PGGPVECRVGWRGQVALRVAKVLLFQVEGANLNRFFYRAPQPTPSGEPKNLPYISEPRPSPEIFPRSSQPESKLIVVDLRSLPSDWQFLLFTLQGLVNRTKPQLYFLFNPTDELWLDWMLKKGWVKATEKADDPKELIRRFRSFVKGMVIYDPLLPATKNVATMLCGVEDAVAVSPRLARELNLPVVADLRGKWRSNHEAYEWAFKNLWTKLNHHVIACSYPDHIGLRDYLVQHRVFIFWISGPIDGARRGGDPNTEVSLMERLLAQMPVNIPVMSYPWAGQDVGIGEGAGVTLFSEFGKFLVGSINCTNLSVHSGITVPKFHQKPAPPPPNLQLDKVYYSIIISDGDNLPVLTNFNFPQLWQSPVRGKLPLGWTISPSAIMLIPAIVDYYYETATPNDYFLGAVSGIGYCYPDHYGKRFREPDKARIFDEFLERTATYMDRMDLRELWIMGVTRSELIRRYAEKIHNLKALFIDYGRRLSEPTMLTYPTVRQVGVFHAATGWREEDDRQERINHMVNEIRMMTPHTRPAFLHVFVWNWGFDLEMLQEVAKRLGGDYIPVRPDHLAQLYRQWLTQQQLLVRSPALMVAIEGNPTAFEVSVFNASQRALNVSVSVERMKETQIRPKRATIRPSEEKQFTIAGIPMGDKVKLTTSGGAVTRQVEVPVELLRRTELIESIPEGTAMRFVDKFEAEMLPHLTGEPEQDESASGKTVWIARRGKGKVGHMVFGPYVHMGKGRYIALFRLKRMSEGEGAVAVVDSCVGGGSPITAQRQVTAQQLPIGKFQFIPLTFTHPGGALETRVFWTGQADLAVDFIAVWRIDETK
ncbi:MAG: GxGYxYP domain-containing protein, partial [Candidatus Fervidibacter sp.]|uniref:GxGYxYP domain-containing protein n=1 Tax=Candidatus Fervidibacter sp. TaxID=3100871 RepID=UPI0040492193